MKVLLSFLVGLTVSCLATLPAPVAANHAFTAEFDGDKPVTLKGTVSRVEWINPHSWVYIDVAEGDGRKTTWKIECGAPNQLMRRGWNKNSIPVGAQVTVEGYRAKNGSNTANAKDIVNADGKRFFVGSSGTGAPFDQKTDQKDGAR
jgi:hypothetical protein